MADELGKEFAKEAVKEVAKDVYSDVAKPIAKPTGELVGLVPRAIKAALAPVEKWVLQREYNVAETKKLLEEKLSSVSPEFIEAPEPHIAVPALQYISYCMDNEELRDMYANLLANSMNKVVKNGVHPGFVEIIKQLCPDEAKFMKHIFSTEHKRIPTINLRLQAKTGGYVDIVRKFTDVPESCGCENKDNLEQYIDNLERLGLLKWEERKWMLEKVQERYDALIDNIMIMTLINQISSSKEISEMINSHQCVEGILILTEFGKRFCSMCMNDSAIIETKDLN